MANCSDPADYSSDETTSYPFSWWLPGEGVQRGTILWRDGDPSTPMYPAIGIVNVRKCCDYYAMDIVLAM